MFSLNTPIPPSFYWKTFLWKFPVDLFRSISDTKKDTIWTTHLEVDDEDEGGWTLYCFWWSLVPRTQVMILIMQLCNGIQTITCKRHLSLNWIIGNISEHCDHHHDQCHPSHHDNNSHYRHHHRHTRHHHRHNLYHHRHHHWPNCVKCLRWGWRLNQRAARLSPRTRNETGTRDRGSVSLPGFLSLLPSF